jgi:hypothetical protein
LEPVQPGVGSSGATETLQSPDASGHTAARALFTSPSSTPYIGSMTHIDRHPHLDQSLEMVVEMRNIVCWHIFKQVCFSLMARPEYAVMEKQGQRQLRRDSAEVHTKCKSVLVQLMENKQARKISSAGIMAWKDQKCKLHFVVSDTGHWRSQGSNSRQECRNGKIQNTRIR